MKPPPEPHYRHRFPAEIISHAVRLYHVFSVFSLSLRDVELLMAERGGVVSCETGRRWCKKVGASFADRLRHRRPRPGDKHRPTRRRERQMQRFKSPQQAQDFLSAHSFIYGHFHPRRQQLAAFAFRVIRADAFKVWRQATSAQVAA
ncbi:MAG TPA: hypothetical protein VME47_02960 [Acetobacteraceae bacterium]|nr:hypothetical protein [Acetobacteraceae bacterium]